MSYYNSYYGIYSSPSGCCNTKREVPFNPMRQGCCGQQMARPMVNRDCNTANVPHYTRTVHTQPIVKKWVTEEMKYDQVPIVHDTKQVQYPSIEIDVKKFGCPQRQSSCSRGY